MNQLRNKILSTFSILPNELNRIILTAPHRYKVFYIPKKRTGKLREIAQPAKELKPIQNWIVDFLNPYLPVHDCAVAYRLDRGIKHNALRHTGNRFVLKMDLEDFFPSIVQGDIQKHLAKYAGDYLSAEDTHDICNIVLWSPPNRCGKHLCIGAPSSPFISNSILYDFDNTINAFSMTKEVTYTRYADDLIFSTCQEHVLKDIERFVYKTLDTLDYPKLTVNKNKTIHTSKGRGITITGVVLTPSGDLSISRERKRFIRASIHHFLNQRLSFEDIQKLNGLLAFSQDIEPEFVIRMQLKYGADIWSKIRRDLALLHP